MDWPRSCCLNPKFADWCYIMAGSVRLTKCNVIHVMIRNKFVILRLCLAGLFLLLGGRAWALPDSFPLTATNTWTKQPVVINLQRYNLRATNYQVRIFSDATTYTLLPTNQIPEVTTYRGRITGDPGAVVVGTFGVDGKFYYHVSYGCRWQGSTSEYDSYDTTNRLSWGGMGAYFQTTNLPSLGYVTNYAVAPTNLPQHITWSASNYPTNPAVSYGGPPYLNVLKSVPVQRARIVLDSDYARLFNTFAGSNLTTAILIQEARINDVDYEQARDLGICYQIVCVCVRTNTQLPYTTTTGDLSEENAFWSPDPGYSHGVATNGWFDMVHGSVNVATAAGWAYDPGDFSVMDPSWSGYASGHEMGHNWGQNHYTSVRDYTGDNFWHVAMDGSGLGYSTLDANIAQGLRRTNAKGGIEWVQYNYQLAPHATPDLATTKTNQAVSLNVLLNDYIANSNMLTIVSFETNTAAGGTVTNLGNGVLKYTPATNYVGYDLFHYYVAGTNDLNLKSLTAAKVLVSSDASPLLGEWLLNETTGTTAAEATGNGTAAALYGTASFSSGSVPGIGGGTALHFDGSGYARFKGTWFDSYNTNLSLSLWVKPDATPSGEMMLFMKCSLDANNSPGLRFGMNGSSFFFTGCTVGGQSQFSVTAAVVPQAGVWYHLVGEIDRASGLIRLYVNGVEYTGTSNTRTIPAGEFIAADNWPVLGMANAGDGNKSWLVGALDDVRLYTKALSLAEVQSIYSGAGLLPAGGPHPYDGEGNVAFLPMLTWQPGGTNNFQYNVYLGTNVASVAIATTNSLEFKGQVASAKYIVTNALATNSTYCWRVDEIYGTNVAASGVWSFTTAADGIHSGLKLYLSLDARDTSGTTTFDRSGAPYHDGTLYGSPTNTAGQVNESLTFNGSSTYVQTPALSMGTSNATFLAWLNLNGNQGQYDGVIMCHGGSTWSGMMMASANRLGYQWNDDSGTWGYNSGPVLPTNQWVLAAVVVTNSYAVFYMGQTNGVITATTNNHTHIFQAFDAPVDVGQDPFGGRWFNGLMDEVCIWNRSLSAGEIGQILTNGINGASFAGVPLAPDTNTFTWVGDTDVYWTNALNWATNGTPAAANTVYFNDSAKVTGTQLGTNFSVYGINISGSLRSAGINGTNTLTLGAGGILMTNVSASLAIGAAVALGTAQTWSVADGSTLTMTNKLSGTGNPRLTLDGGGTFNLNNNGSGSSYGGVVVVNNGTLNLPYGWNTPSVTGNVSVGTNGTLVFNSHPYSYGTDNYTTNAGTIIVNGDNQFSNLELRGGLISGTGDLRVGDIWGYSTGGKWASRSNAVTAVINIAYLSLYNVSTIFTVDKGSANPDLLVSAPLKDGGNGSASFTKTGLGSLTLTQPNLYTGNTTNNQGTINLDGPDNILPVTTGLYLATNTILNLININQTVASLTGAGALNLGSGSFTDTTAATNTFGGIISGNPNGAVADDTQTAPPGGFALAGTGKIIFTNLQTYVGDTWITSGTLALSGVGSISTSSNLMVSSGATLDATARTDGTLKLISGQTLAGFGTVAGKVIATNGAAIAPGSVGNVGTLTFNSTVNLTGGQAQMTISKTGAALANDLLTGVTTLTCGGSLVVTNLGPDALAAGDSFDLFNATTFSGAFTNFNLPPLANTNLVWDTSKVAVNGIIAVVAAVTITNQPASVTTNAGSTVVFTVGAGGSTPLGFQWRFNGTNLSGGTLPTLTLTNVQLTNAGNYTVLVTNSASSLTSAVAVLTVNVPVVITNPPASLTVYVNSNATFSVTAGGTPVPAYQWRFNGTNISGATAASYTVTGAWPTNEGNYTVVLTNAANSVTSSPASLSLYREYGRAPLPYPSLVSSNGARHLLVPGFQLGVTNLATTDARTTNASEDGVTLTTAVQAGQAATVKVVASAAGYLNAWLDGNTNGSWADVGEQVFTNIALAGGTNTLNFTVPTNALATAGTWARFRFSSATNLAVTGEAPDGEVEDYQLAISGLTLTYTAGANGTNSGTSPQTVNYGASGSAVTAVPTNGYHFVNWSDSSTANPRTDVNVTNNITVTANFAINTYTLIYIGGPNGTLTGTTTQTVNYAASGTAVSAVANSGYAFTNWSDGRLANPRTDANVTNNLTVTANFVAVNLAPPAITNCNMATSGNAFTLTGTGAAGQVYVLLGAATLPPVTWTPVATNTADANGIFQFTDLHTTNYQQRFYRVTTP